MSPSGLSSVLPFSVLLVVAQDTELLGERDELTGARLGDTADPGHLRRGRPTPHQSAHRAP